MVEDARPSEPGLAPTPKFAVHSTDNKFIMTIGGAVNIIGGADIGNNLYNADGGGIDFTTGAIPVPAVRDHKAGGSSIRSPPISISPSWASAAQRTQ